MLFRRRRDPLRWCPACRSRFACPVDWAEHDTTHWHIELRCGECGNRWDALADDERAKRYDLELNADVTAIARALARLDLERMAVDAETFAAALAHDLIDPADFATSRG
ncbi:MAG TPA: hypothetical protein VFM58_21635 [Solirubrobacteraceae bacterium]|jgi:hypothetical protein|nr:hypothetical protein [Solirubrobacteraceae bacterium]